MIVLGIILLILGLLLPRLHILAPIGGIFIILGILLYLFIPAYQYY